MLTQDMINNIKGNLGDRASGRIGGLDVDVAVLSALNLAIPHCVQEAQPDYYNRTATLPLLTSARAYELPTLDSDGVAIRIKDIYAHRCARADGTEVSMVHLNYREFVGRTINYNLDFEGTPAAFALWGKTNTLYLDYIPTEAYTMTLYVEVYPNIITGADLNIPLTIDDQWNLVVEAFATQYLYLKLQQIDMHRFWNENYLNQKASVSRNEVKKQSHNIDAGNRIPLVTDPINNPFVRSWNS